MIRFTKSQGNTISLQRIVTTPTLDPSVLNQISPPQTKKNVQGLDKEMPVVQRGKEIKSVVEQNLCFLCSANRQLSVLRWKKVLVNIIREKISLAKQPLPDAKRFLFGEDFPSVSSKQAELFQDLAKNLSNISKPKQPQQKNLTNRDRQRPRYTDTFTKSQSNRSKSYRPFDPHNGASNQDSTHSSNKILDLTAPLIDTEVLKFLSWGAITKIPFTRKISTEDCSQPPKRRASSPCDRSHLNKFVEKCHFQMENISYLKNLRNRGDFLRSVDLKDAHLSVHVHESS